MNEQKLDKILDTLVDLKIEQTAIRKDLNYHIYRTDLAEERLERMEAQVSPVVFKVNAILWVIGGALGLAPIMLKIVGVWK